MENVKQMLQEGYLEITAINSTTVKMKGPDHKMTMKPSDGEWQDFYTYLNECIRAFDNTAREPGQNIEPGSTEDQPP